MGGLPVRAQHDRRARPDPGATLTPTWPWCDPKLWRDLNPNPTLTLTLTRCCSAASRTSCGAPTRSGSSLARRARRSARSAPPPPHSAPSPPLSTPLPPQQPSPLHRPRPPPPPPTPGALLGPARYLVGWQPLQSMEQIGPLLVFGLLQGLQLAASLAHRLKLDPARAAVLRMQVGLGSRAVLYSVAAAVGSLPSTFYRH